MFAVVEIFLIIYVIADLQPNYAKSIQNSITNTSLSSKGGKIIDIRELLNLKPNEFSPYRERLIKRGLINGDERGIVRFTLPCFEDYVLNNYLGDE